MTSPEARQQASEEPVTDHDAQEKKLLSAFVHALDELPPARHERALQAALDNFAAEPIPAPRKLRAWAVIAAAAAIALVGAIGFSLRAPPSSQLASAGDKTAPAVAGVRELTSGAEAQVGPATIRAIEPSTLGVPAGERSIHLHSGSVSLSVKPTPHSPFRVTTAGFIVEVIGTRFSVDPLGVTVYEGSVRVLGPTGTPIKTTLVAGESWRRSQAREPEPALVGESLQQAPSADASSKRDRARPGVVALLADARAQIAARNTEHARRLLAAAMSQKPSASQAAEAETLLAECAQVEGRPAAAVSSYERIAEQQTDRGAAENALFAAGRLAAESGDVPKAQQLLARYLERYPEGRFRKEAATRLKALASKR